MYEAVEPIKEKTCRICLESETDDDKNDDDNKTHHSEFINPCQCRGFSKYVHRDCLDKWRCENYGQHFYACDICHYQYRISRVWWSRLLSHKIVPVLGTLAILPTCGWMAGIGSASLYNLVYYWFMHDVYHLPHRMQILFHTLMWLGIPGLYMTLKNIWSIRAIQVSDQTLNSWVNALSASLNYQAAVQRPALVEIHHHHNEKYRDSPRPPRRRRTDDDDDKNGDKKDKNDKDDDDKDENKKKTKSKETPIAPYERHGTILILTLVGGTFASFYYTIRWMHRKCKRWAQQCAEYIQNVE